MIPRLFALGAAIGIVLAATAARADDGWYGSFHLGGAYLLDAEVDTRLRGGGSVIVPDGSEFAYDLGWSFGGTVGYDLGFLRFDVELNYNKNTVSRLNSTPATGELTTISYLLNGYLDFDVIPNTTVYIGGGVGVSSQKLVVHQARNGNLIANTNDPITPTWQIGGGIGYAFSHRWMLTLDYRLVDANFFSPDFRTPAPESQVFRPEYFRNDVRLGIRMYF
jgi:opacity protein-like surface antigen